LHYRIVGYLKDIILIIISSFLLVISFPSYDLSIFAWVGLVPFLLVIIRRNPIHAFIFSIMWALFFFTGTFHWIFVIRKYTVLHDTLLVHPLS
jgi:apolipoprotein N-acyltransferase